MTQIFILIIKWALQLVEYLIKKRSNQDIIQEPVIEQTQPVQLPEVVVTEPIIIPDKPDISKLVIINKFLPTNAYVQDSKFFVNQVVLHHTAGGSAQSTINYWMSDKQRVATHFIIDRDGTVYQCIPLEKSWGYNIYVSSPGNKIDPKYKKLGSKYDAQIVGIELCNYGYVNFSNGKFVNYVGKLMHSSQVVNIPPYKGYGYWEDYTDEQIKSLELLLLKLIQEYPVLEQGLLDDYSSIGEISKQALEMKPGIYGHSNYRTDKFDVYPNPKLIKMLNSLHEQVDFK